jgi:hypothetical protein
MHVQHTTSNMDEYHNIINISRLELLMGCRLYYAVYPTKMHPSLMVAFQTNDSDQRFRSDVLPVDYSRHHARQPNDRYSQGKTYHISRLADQRRHHSTHCPHLGVHAILVARAIRKIAF